MRTSRRAAITATGGLALGLSGCSGTGSGASSLPSSSAPSTATSTATQTKEALPDPDRTSLERAWVITSTLVADLAASAPVIDIGGELAEIHAAHLAALEGAAEDLVATAPSPSTPRRLTPVRLRRRELAAQRELAGMAQQAESGALARLLASMSAGIAAGLSHRGEVAQ